MMLPIEYALAALFMLALLLGTLLSRHASEPTCPICGKPAEAASDQLISESPWVLETTYQCRNCRRSFSRVIVAGVES